MIAGEPHYARCDHSGSSDAKRNVGADRAVVPRANEIICAIGVGARKPRVAAQTVCVSLHAVR
jgi:hypothetical protein